MTWDLRSASLERPIHIARDVLGELHDAPRVCLYSFFIPDVTKILHTPRTHKSTQRFYLSSWSCFTTGPTRCATSGLRAHVTYNTLIFLFVYEIKESGTEGKGKERKREERGEANEKPRRIDAQGQTSAPIYDTHLATIQRRLSP